MGYARLAFTTASNTSAMLYEIVRVITGNVTAAANLTVANTVNSEIVNTLNQNWTAVYGNTANLLQNSFVLSSPCVTSTKTHFVRLFGSNGGAWNTANTMSNAFAGINLTTVSAATSNTSVSNETYYYTNIVNATVGNGIGQMVTRITSNANPYIYLSWSSRHLLMYGARASGFGTGITASFEYPETSLTQFANSAPVLNYRFSTFTAGFENNTTSGIGAGNNTVAQAVSLYVPSAAATQGGYAIGSNGFGTISGLTFDPVVSINATGTQAYPLLPLYWSRPSDGIPTINLSTLSNIYRVSNTGLTPESFINIGSNSYVSLTVGSNIASLTGTIGIVLLKA